jgi:signal peptidase
MQKSNISTLIILTIVFIYGVFSQYVFSNVEDISVYIYYANPILWIVFAGVLNFTISDTLYKNAKLRNNVIQYILIGGLVYIITYLIAGLFVTFGNNPYSNTIKGFFINLWITGTVIIAREYIRYKLINNVYDRYKIKVGIVIVVTFSLIEFGILSFIMRSTSGYYIFQEIMSNFIPIIIKNILFTYIAMNAGFIAPVLYQFIMHLFLWISPILPNSPWVLKAFIDTLIPSVILLYIIYEKNRKNIFKVKQGRSVSNPTQILPIAILLIIIIWFAMGIFPVKPLSIASASMKPTIEVGDVVIMKKCKPEEVIIGDIIEFTNGSRRTVHRVIDITKQNGKYYFVTKGDNNSEPDRELVLEDALFGKYIFRIKYIGLPAIWLTNMKGQ